MASSEFFWRMKNGSGEGEWLRKKKEKNQEKTEREIRGPYLPFVEGEGLF